MKVPKPLNELVGSFCAEDGLTPALQVQLRDGTQVTHGWIGPYEIELPAIHDHLIAAVHAGSLGAHLSLGGEDFCYGQLPGLIVIAPHDQAGAWSLYGKIQVSHLVLAHERLTSCANDLQEGRAFSIQPAVAHHDQMLFSLMRVIRQEMEDPKKHSTVLLETVVDLVCIHLLRQYCIFSHTVLQQQRGLAPWQVRRVVGFMRENLSSVITLQDLANVVNLSRFHFCSAFRIATGATPHEFLRNLRMDVACELIKGSNLSIREIGQSVGYETASAFTSAFHKALKCTPSQYRRKS